MDDASHEQAYLFVADRGHVFFKKEKKPVVLKKKTRKRGRSGRIDRRSEDVDYLPNTELK